MGDVAEEGLMCDSRGRRIMEVMVECRMLCKKDVHYFVRQEPNPEVTGQYLNLMNYIHFIRQSSF